MRVVDEDVDARRPRAPQRPRSSSPGSLRDTPADELEIARRLDRVGDRPTRPAGDSGHADADQGSDAIRQAPESIVGTMLRALPLLSSSDLQATAEFYRRLGFTNKGAPARGVGLPHHRIRRRRVSLHRADARRAAAGKLLRVHRRGGCRLRRLDLQRRLHQPGSRRSRSRTSGCGSFRCSTHTETRSASARRRADGRHQSDSAHARGSTLSPSRRTALV